MASHPKTVRVIVLATYCMYIPMRSAVLAEREVIWSEHCFARVSVSHVDAARSPSLILYHDVKIDDVRTTCKSFVCHMTVCVPMFRFFFLFHTQDFVCRKLNKLIRIYLVCCLQTICHTLRSCLRVSAANPVAFGSGSYISRLTVVSTTFRLTTVKYLPQCCRNFN